MLANFAFRKAFLFGIIISLAFFASSAIASDSNGTIDTTYKYAWGENIGWINFGCDQCGVTVNDSGISGYAWSQEFGWINLAPNQGGVQNTSAGVLSGRAWGSNLGWIDFSGVVITEGGEFSGYATLDSNASRINFNCGTGGSCAASDFKVKTDWRPASVRSGGSTGGGNASGSSGGGNAGDSTSTDEQSEPAPVDESAEEDSVLPSAPVANVIEAIEDFFGLEPEPVVTVPEIAPFAFTTQWNLLPVNAINSFVFAPLPYEVRVLAAKFPELGRVLKEVGVDRLSDLNKLSGVTFTIEGLTELEKTLKTLGVGRLGEIDPLSGVSLDIPGFSDTPGQIRPGIGAGKIALISGLPVAKFPLVLKKNLPSEFVFARSGGELLDLNVSISVTDEGSVSQTISSLPGKTLKLVVKPISSAKSVTGYFIYKAATPRITKNITEISRASLSASVLFSLNDLVEKDPEPISIENKLVLSSFEYTDPDRDGIYTADVQTPVVPGEYEVITVIEYNDPTLGTRQMRMITVIDPEGYVFEKNGGKETRIPSAIVSLYELNVATKKYELWDAKAYQQENPQITDVRGTYSFLVPEGTYYFHVEAPGYDTFTGKAFVVKEGTGIHQNIELGAGFSLANIDWKTVLLIVVLLLLMYNLYRNRERDKLLKALSKQNGK